MKRTVSIMLTLMIGALLLAACGSSAGDTSCSTYRGKQTSNRLAVVKQMMSDRHLSTGTGTVIGTELSVDAYCFSHSTDAHIDGIYSG